MSKKKIDAEKLLTGLVAPNTLSSYLLSWKDYFKFAGNFTSAMTGATLNLWRQHLINEKNYSASTVNSRLFAIKAIARELYGIGEISRDSYWDIKEVRVLSRQALKERRRPNNRTRIEPEQMRAICTAPPVSEENSVALRDRALMMVLATTGVRISEAINMKINDIAKLPNNQFAVRNILGKYQSEPRVVPLSPEAYSCIMDWLAFRPINSPYVFTSINYSEEDGGILYTGEPINRNTAGMRIKAYGEQAGVENVKPHDFRRFVGTQLAKTDIRQAQKVLGHANLATTASYYVMDEVIIGTTDSLF